MEKLHVCVKRRLASFTVKKNVRYGASILKEVTCVTIFLNEENIYKPIFGKKTFLKAVVVRISFYVKKFEEWPF